MQENECKNLCYRDETICKHCRENFEVSSEFFKAKRLCTEEYVTGYLVKGKSGTVIGILNKANNFRELAAIDEDCIQKVKKYPIATICCSTRYVDSIIKLYNELPEEGYIVLADLTDHDRQQEFDKEMIDNMHRAKIDMANYVYILAKDDIMGESVSSEYKYALKAGKEIRRVSIK